MIPAPPDPAPPEPPAPVEPVVEIDAGTAVAETPVDAGESVVAKSDPKPDPKSDRKKKRDDKKTDAKTQPPPPPTDTATKGSKCPPPAVPGDLDCDGIPDTR